jgi:hypothetical protein
MKLGGQPYEPAELHLETNWVFTEQEAGQAPEPVWIFWDTKCAQKIHDMYAKFRSGILKGRSLLEEPVGERGCAADWSTALQPTRLWSRFPMASMTQPFRPQYDPAVDWASIRNEYQEYFLGDKGGRCVDLTNVPPSCEDSLEIWVPQPSGTLRFTVPASK